MLTSILHKAVAFQQPLPENCKVNVLAQYKADDTMTIIKTILFESPAPVSELRRVRGRGEGARAPPRPVEGEEDCAPHDVQHHRQVRDVDCVEAAL